MLPCLALETPVLFVSDGAMTASMSRFDGLQELTHSLSESEYLSNPLSYDVDEPPKNSLKYMALRKDLQKKCHEFTGYDNSQSFARGVDFTKFVLKDCLELILYNQDYISSRKIQAKDSQILDLQNENERIRSDELSSRRLLKQIARNARHYTSHFFHK